MECFIVLSLGVFNIDKADKATQLQVVVKMRKSSTEMIAGCSWVYCRCIVLPDRVFLCNRDARFPTGFTLGLTRYLDDL